MTKKNKVNENKILCQSKLKKDKMSSGWREHGGKENKISKVLQIRAKSKSSQRFKITQNEICIGQKSEQKGHGLCLCVLNKMKRKITITIYNDDRIVRRIYYRRYSVWCVNLLFLCYTSGIDHSQ